MHTEKTFQQVVEDAEQGFYDDEYADYLMRCTDAKIGNGDALIYATESGLYWDQFLEWLEEKFLDGKLHFK